MIALAADHGGFSLKEEVRAWLDEQGIAYRDFGSYDGASCDYPDMAAPACEAVVSGECERALLFCGTGIGISIAGQQGPGHPRGLLLRLLQREIHPACTTTPTPSAWVAGHRPGACDRAGRRLSPHRIRGRTPPAPHRQDFRFGKQVIHHTISTDRGT